MVRKRTRGRTPEDERALLLAREVGGGLCDLAIGAATRHAPTLQWASERERNELIEKRIAEANSFRKPFALATDKALSTETRDALGVWDPFALRHLLTLDPTPRASLRAARDEAKAADALVQRWMGVGATFRSAADAIWEASVIEPRRTFSATSAALRDVVMYRQNKAWDKSRSLQEEDVKSDPVETLEQARRIVLGLLADVERNAQFETWRLERARKEQEQITGASTWSRHLSLAASRNLVTLVDALRDAYGAREWPWPRVAKLVQESSSDWALPPSPDLASKSLEAITAGLKVRDGRERRRLASLRLSKEDIYPWRRRSNRIG